MAAEGTGADSLRAYLTGAAVAASQQSDPALSLGLYRSCVRANALTPTRYTPISGIRIDFVSGACGTGNGVLTVPTVDSISWCAPGDSAGAAVTISDGETLVLLSDDEDKYIIVTRITDADLGGTETVTLLDTFNNVIGGTNFTGDEAAAGEEKYRAAMLEFVLAATDCWVWLDAANAADLKFAIETPVAGALTDETGNGEETQPPGLTWRTVSTEGTAYHLGAQDALDLQGLWVERSVGVAEACSPHVLGVVHVGWTVAGTTYYTQFRGLNRIANNDTAGYEAWIGTDSSPDLTGAADVTSTTKPFSLGAMAADHDYYIVIGYRNQWGLIAYDDEEIIRVGPGGTEDPTPPSGPGIVQLDQEQAGIVRVNAIYYSMLDAATDSEATDWAVYVTADGTDPDPDVDSPTIVAMTRSRNGCILDWDTSEYLEDTPVKVLVRTRYTVGESTQVYSENTSAESHTVEWFGPIRPGVTVAHGQQFGQSIPPTTPPDEIVYVDEAKNIRFVLADGYAQFWADTVLIWNYKYNTSRDAPHSGLYSHFSWRAGDVSGAGDDSTVEVASWTAEDKTIYINVGPDPGVRRMKIDVTNTTITVDKMTKLPVPSASRSDDPAWPKYGHTCFQVWDSGTEEWATAASLSSAGVFSFKGVHKKVATQGEAL